MPAGNLARSRTTGHLLRSTSGHLMRCSSCVECEYCNTVASWPGSVPDCLGQWPGCPTATGCCTPSWYEASISGLQYTTACLNCITAHSVKVTTSPPASKTLILRQNPSDPCEWRATYGTIVYDFWSGSGCSGGSIGTETATLVASMRRTSATNYNFDIAGISDVSGHSVYIFTTIAHTVGGSDYCATWVNPSFTDLGGYSCNFGNGLMQLGQNGSCSTTVCG